MSLLESLKEVNTLVFLLYVGIITYGEKVAIVTDLIFLHEEGGGKGSQAEASAEAREDGVSANASNSALTGILPLDRPSIQ